MEPPAGCENVSLSFTPCIKRSLLKISFTVHAKTTNIRDAYMVFELFESLLYPGNYILRLAYRNHRWSRMLQLQEFYLILQIFSSDRNTSDLDFGDSIDNFNNIMRQSLLEKIKKPVIQTTEYTMLSIEYKKPDGVKQFWEAFKEVFKENVANHYEKYVVILEEINVALLLLEETHEISIQKSLEQPQEVRFTIPGVTNNIAVNFTPSIGENVYSPKGPMFVYLPGLQVTIQHDQQDGETPQGGSFRFNLMTIDVVDLPINPDSLTRLKESVLENVLELYKRKDKETLKLFTPIGVSLYGAKILLRAFYIAYVKIAYRINPNIRFLLP